MPEPQITTTSRPAPPPGPQAAVRAERRPIGESASRSAIAADWDRYADEYQASHGAFLGDAGFLWGPEGCTERALGVLGDVADTDVLEVGSGAGQCARWVLAAGGRPVGIDVSARQLQHSRRLDKDTGLAVPVIRATATHLPFADHSFDIVFSSFGALQFVHDIDRAIGETARVLRSGGRFAFSITHPCRWSFPDDPGPDGLTASQSYWDRTPYVEISEETGEVNYVEHHRTLGDWVRLLTVHGFALRDLVEPEWPADHDRVWGGWSRTRGLLVPGTAIFAADRAGSGTADHG
ncbi:MAG: class I SAM-dependent methyltransferase [Nocardioides sp.]